LTAQVGRNDPFMGMTEWTSIALVGALALCVLLLCLCCALRRRYPANVAPKDELHRMETEITEVFRCMSGRFNTEEVTLTNILDSYDRFASAPRELVFGRPAQAALGVEAYMCVPDNIVHQGRIDGTAAIVSEVNVIAPIPVQSPSNAHS